MASLNLTNTLRAEYQKLFDTCQINTKNSAEVETICNKIIANKARYETAGKGKIPWFFIGAIHNMESSLKFTGHLHNGDPLTAKTKQVPAGRPKTGKPPFTWEESAKDALSMKKLFDWTDWTIAGILYRLELYNGIGYRLYHPSIKSPYLWSYSNHYTKGKYIADGTWSDTAVSKQCGAATILRRLTEKQVIAFDKKSEPIITPTTEDEVVIRLDSKPLVEYAPTKYNEHAEKLQAALNQFPGIFLKVDGKAGQKTSDGLKLLVGHYLKGDPKG